MTKRNKYRINGVDFELKEKYPLKDWAEILEILQTAKSEDAVATTITLIKGGNLERLVSLITGEKITELYDVDMPEITRLITDFFSRKNSLTSVTAGNSESSTPSSTSRVKN